MAERSDAFEILETRRVGDRRSEWRLQAAGAKAQVRKMRFVSDKSLE
jgi:hypothetical protein